MPLYTDAHAELTKKRAGQPWRPGNGYEGELFAERVCYDCANCDEDGYGCEISLKAFFVCDTSDPDYPKEWVYGEDGQPKCTAFQEARDD